MTNANDHQPGCVAFVLLVKVIGQTSANFKVNGGGGDSGDGGRGEGAGGEGGGREDAASRASRCTSVVRSMFSPLTPGEEAHVARVRNDSEYNNMIDSFSIRKSQIDRLRPVPKGKEDDTAYYMDDEIINAVVKILMHSFPDPNIVVFYIGDYTVLAEYYGGLNYDPAATYSVLSQSSRGHGHIWGISKKLRDVSLLKKEKLVFPVHHGNHFFFVVVWFQPAVPPLITVVDSLGGAHPGALYTKSCVS